MFFGNVRQAYRTFRTQNHTEIQNFFLSKTFRIGSLAGRSDRGSAMTVNQIPKDDRYLIAEMACKSYEPADDALDNMLSHLIAEFGGFKKTGGKKTLIKNLLEGKYTNKNKDRQGEFSFSAVEFLDEEISDVDELKEKYKRYYNKFKTARKLALRNTELYLSMINDLDVYVATSMRTRDDFRKMADNCETIFEHEDIKDLNIRYFDPTLSAAPGHEDKGMIECLMVKCAKVLIYMAGDKESYGKDAEAAMALSLGKPVIFYCDEERRSRFYRDVHPLSRLVDFNTGVAVGAVVTSNLLDVPKLLRRMLCNEMEYELVREKKNYLKLKERLTQSVVRVQTNNTLLRETFWNHYHNPV